MDYADIARVCHEVARLSDSANWRFKGAAVIQWEFATISDFMRARADVTMALQDVMKFQLSDAAWQRAVSPDILELDCHGVTFRLVCSQRVAHPGFPGGVGAAQMKMPTIPKFDPWAKRGKPNGEPE